MVSDAQRQLPSRASEGLHHRVRGPRQTYLGPRPAVDDRSFADSSLLAYPQAANLVMQGIATFAIGTPVWDGQAHTGARPGKVLRRQ